jgi:hypothetical protein
MGRRKIARGMEKNWREEKTNRQGAEDAKRGK